MPSTTSPLLITPRFADLGHGLTVRRLLPAAAQRSVGPFVFFDHAGPVTLAAEDTSGADVRPHPHIGLATVSYLLSGEIVHRDSLGTHTRIRPGAVNWMTAGRGITHSERFEHPASFAGGGLELLQLWVALPEELEECEPAFAHTDADALPVRDAGGAWLRVVAGTVYGLTSPVQTASPLFYVHAELQAGAELALPTGYSERAAYVVRGALEYQGTRYSAGQMVVFASDATGALSASEAATVMLLGGEPLGHRHLFWNFVSTSRERIEQAKADWAAGRFTLPPDDNKEWIPLPGTPAAPLAEPGAGTVPPANAS
ncbi:MAG: pirin family protein [Simplicispira suum]|uniref:pirin family protein n=1 Tax=Simplicispira suum TaxID=2109915 RepID=UPI001C6B5846|nr:pirin family protein [Simplicispira suum]MBW7833436.1 pirin family protein [Simplicispira suum]